MPRSSSSRFTIARAVARVESWYRGGSGNRPSDQEFAKAAGMSPASYSEVTKKASRKPRQSATLAQLGALSRVFRTAVSYLFDRDCDPFLFDGEGGTRWRYAGPVAGVREQALRVAAAGVVQGRPPEEIREEIHTLRRAGGSDREPQEAEIRRMARGGLSFRLVELDRSEEGDEILDRRAAKRLADALEALIERRPEVHVVKNLGHEDFLHDPAAPHLIALVAHDVVNRFIEENPIFTIGIAGGLHVATFVRHIGAASPPIPDTPGGDKRYTIVPLTLEPMDDHKVMLANSLAGEMSSRLSALIGPDRVRAPSFHAFGYLRDRRIQEIKADTLSHGRQLYEDLDVAIYGCGDRADDGWIGQALTSLGIQPSPEPATDVCLNLLSKEGERIQLTEDHRELLGVGLTELEHVVRNPEKLALLLASGKRKGLPLVLVAKAGMADTIICDTAAAEAAIAAARKLAASAAGS